jgi:ankyrin repeat protein
MEKIKITQIEDKFLDACGSTDLNTVKELLPKIQDLNFSFGHNSPISHAIINDSVELLELLIKHGANISNDYHLVDCIQSIPMLERLISHGLDIYHSQDEKESPLYFMIIFSQLDVAKKMIELGVEYKHLDFSENPLRQEEMNNFIVQFEAKKEKQHLESNLSPIEKISKIKI